MTAGKPRSIKFTDTDWQALQALAGDSGITVSKLIHEAVGEFAAKRGVSLAGTGNHGDPRRFRQDHQCPNCAGWNVGTFEGRLICADCGAIVSDNHE